jgi:hypothetical protein
MNACTRAWRAVGCPYSFSVLSSFYFPLLMSNVGLQVVEIYPFFGITCSFYGAL